MTTPAAPQQYPPGQQPPQQPADNLDDPALAVALAAILAGGVTAASAALSAAAAMTTLRARFALSDLATASLRGVLASVLADPPPVTGVIGNASAQSGRSNLARRTQYVIAAAKRVLGAALRARAQGKPVIAAIAAQLEVERRFYAQHKAAMWNRARAAGTVDVAAATFGPLLGWLAVHDDRTSAECLAADGKNFYATAVPDIGWPGSVHPHCRCQPVQPWPGARLLPSSAAGFATAA